MPVSDDLAKMQRDNERFGTFVKIGFILFILGAIAAGVSDARKDRLCREKGGRMRVVGTSVSGMNGNISTSEIRECFDKDGKPVWTD